MKCTHRRRYLPLAIALAAAGLAQGVTAADAETQFKYSDEWSLVSAPPPAGPYQPVNIDPRVPGPGTIPQVPMPRLQAADEVPADAGMVEGTVSADMPESYGAGMPEDQVAPVPTLAMPPIPGHYQPVMPPPAEGLAVESGARMSETVAAPAAEMLPPAGMTAPALAVESAGAAGSAPAGTETVAVPAVDATPPTGEAVQELAIETGEAAQPLPAETETLAAPAEGVLPAAEVAAPALAIEAGEAAGPAGTGQETIATPLPETLPMQEEVPVPAYADSMPPAGDSGQPATALQQGQPYYPQQYPMPGYYDRLPAPAAGRMGDRTAPAVPGPAEALQESAGAVSAPAPGYYGRRAPAPGYGYQMPAYPYQGMPDYRGAPSYGYPQGPQWSGDPGNQPYGYPGGQTWSGEQDIPPPPMYDSMQRPREPIQGYR